MNRIQGTSLGRGQNEFLHLPEPSLRALLVLGPEEAIMPQPWGQGVHPIVDLPSTFSLLSASEVLAVNFHIL